MKRHCSCPQQTSFFEPLVIPFLRAEEKPDSFMCSKKKVEASKMDSVQVRPLLSQNENDTLELRGPGERGSSPCQWKVTVLFVVVVVVL